MTKKQAWIKALRLRTLPLSLSGIILGSAIACYNGYWSTSIFVLALLTTVLFQIVSNLANDLGDTLKGADNEDRIGPMRAVQSGTISPQEMRNAVIFTSLLSLLSALALVYIGTQNMPPNILWLYVTLTGLCILAAVTYTIGKKAYGYSGFGDIFVFIFFGLVSILGVYTLYSKTFDWINIFPAVSIGLLSTAVLNLNNMRDQYNDRKVGKNTLVVKIGGNNAKFYHALLIISSFSFFGIFIYSMDAPLAYLGLSPYILLLIHLRKVMSTVDPSLYDPELKKVALSTFATAVLIGAMLLLQLRLS